MRKCVFPIFSCVHLLVYKARRRVFYRPDHVLKRCVNCIIHNSSIQPSPLCYVQQFIVCTAVYCMYSSIKEWLPRFLDTTRILQPPCDRSADTLLAERRNGNKKLNSKNKQQQAAANSYMEEPAESADRKKHFCF